MNLVDETSPINGETHSDNLVLLIAAKNAVTPAALRTMAPAFFNGTEVYTLMPATTTMPKTWVIQDVVTNEALIILCGMTFVGQADAVLASWAQADAEATDANVFELAARQVLAGIPYPFITAVTKVRIVGHSFGGAVGAWITAKLWDDPFGVRDMLCYTYGAPKPGYERAMLYTVRQKFRRVFLANDPVSALPPAWSNMNSLWALVGVPLARKWSRWDHSVSGLGVENGEMYATWFSNQDAGNYRFYLTIADWVFGTTAFGSDNHTLEAYQRALATVPNVGVRNAQPETTYRPTHGALPTAVVMEAAQGVAIATQAFNTAGNITGTVATIQQTVTLQPGVRYRGAYANGTPAVYYGEQFVTFARTTRVRRAIVRRLNRNLIPAS